MQSRNVCPAALPLVLLTFIGFRLRLNVGTTACLYWIVIVLLSLRGSFLSSAIVSLIAVGSLAYYFAPPIFDFRVRDPIDAAAVIAFLTTSAVITRLVSRLRDSEEELRRRSTYLVEAQRLSLTGSVGWSVSNGELVWSEETFRIVQYHRTKKPTMDTCSPTGHPEDAALVEQTIQRALQEGKDYDSEHRLLMPDGSLKHLHVMAHASKDKSGGIEFAGTVTDVTAANEAEQRIRQTESELRTIIETIPAFIVTCLPDGSVDFVSPSWVDRTGCSREQLLNSGWTNIIHPEDFDRTVSDWRAALAAGEPAEMEARYRRADGEYRWFFGRFVPLRNERGKIIKWYGTLHDIEDRKRVEEKLLRSEALLAQAQSISHTGSFGGDVRGGELFWSEETFRIFEYDLTATPSLELMRQRIHPDDRDRLRQIRERADSDGTNYDIEYRLLMPDGRVKHLHVVGHRLEDSRFVGAVTDITAAKQTEEALRASEQQWRDVFENNPTMYFMVDAEGTVRAVNPYGAEQLGYTVDELVGQPVLRVFYESDREEVLRNLALCLLAPVIEDAKGSEKQLGYSMSWEARKVRKDGSVLWVRETARATLRGNDRVVLIACEDITERRNAEAKIRQQELELRQIIDLAPQHVAVLGPDRSRFPSETSPNINQAALDYHGVTLEEWQSSDLRRFFHPDDWERMWREDESKVLMGSPYENEARLLRHDGKYRWFLFRHNPVRDEQGRITRWYVAATDIEDRKQEEQRLQDENVALREEIDRASMFEEIVGTSPVLQAVLSRLSKVAPTDSSVLVTGETGTGKELVARAIHRLSRRSLRPFVSVNCAAIPRALIASELFGHEKGAFTGATQRRLGRFELAEGGTIFLDEVGELPGETQIALLRVLQEHEFERVGGTQCIRTDVRVIAATNRDLQSAIAAGTFRRDLFYRLNVFPIEVPPLRERREDIPLLVEYFIDRYARKAGKAIRGINKKSLDLLQSYPWPGNIRELQNVIERSVIVCETENFSVDESWLSRQPLATEQGSQLEFSEKVAAREKEMIEAALSESGGRVFGPLGAAARLGMPRSTLESKIRSLKIDKNRFKT